VAQEVADGVGVVVGGAVEDEQEILVGKSWSRSSRWRRYSALVARWKTRYRPSPVTTSIVPNSHRATEWPVARTRSGRPTAW